MAIFPNDKTALFTPKGAARIEIEPNPEPPFGWWVTAGWFASGTLARYLVTGPWDEVLYISRKLARGNEHQVLVLVYGFHCPALKRVWDEPYRLYGGDDEPFWSHFGPLS